MSLIGEHVDVCNPPISERSICTLEAPAGSRNEGIFSTIPPVNKDLTCWLASRGRRRLKRKDELPDAAGIYDAATQQNRNLSK